MAESWLGRQQVRQHLHRGVAEVLWVLWQAVVCGVCGVSTVGVRPSPSLRGVSSVLRTLARVAGVKSAESLRRGSRAKALCPNKASGVATGSPWPWSNLVGKPPHHQRQAGQRPSQNRLTGSQWPSATEKPAGRQSVAASGTSTDRQSVAVSCW